MIDKGNTDYFRIQIWNKTSGATLYDNMPQRCDLRRRSDPTTLTPGGNIVIHK